MGHRGSRLAYAAAPPNPRRQTCAPHVTTAQPEHPCLSCGACCASFRVDFSVQETQAAGGDVPDGLAVEVTDDTARMRGTDHAQPRCAALTGRVGTRAACGIYEWRPSPCREFAAGSEACQRARRRHQLPTLEGDAAALA